eukprot:4743859-Lingulodinium_polyedra.AAC.1
MVPAPAIARVAERLRQLDVHMGRPSQHDLAGLPVASRLALQAAARAAALQRPPPARAELLVQAGAAGWAIICMHRGHHGPVWCRGIWAEPAWAEASIHAAHAKQLAHVDSDEAHHQQRHINLAIAITRAAIIAAHSAAQLHVVIRLPPDGRRMLSAPPCKPGQLTPGAMAFG